MRPYLAIIKDSFREAFATRVLWMTLLAITLFLAALLPIRFEERIASELRRPEIINGFGLVETWQEQSTSANPSPGKHLWGLMDSKTQQTLVDSADQVRERPEQSRRYLGRVQRELNQLLENPEFYDESAWQEISLTDELQASAKDNDIDEATRGARNRQLLAAAFPPFIELQSDDAIYASYLGMEIEFPLPVTPEQLQEVIQQVVAAATSLILGALGVFVAILVTASIIPRTFDAGEITLLLSKPISRSWLFIAKFLGGCAFTFVNVAYLLIGLWLVVGLKFDVWNHNLLLCIPVYLFLFSIYYSVSAWVGARWQSPILAVTATILFWFGLFLLNTLKATLENFYVSPRTIREIIPAGEALLAVTESRDTFLWDAEQRDWREVFEPTGGRPPAFARRFAFADSRFRPRFDVAKQRIVAVEPVFGRFGNSGTARVVAGQAADDWRREELGNTPDVVRELFLAPDGRIVCVARSGIFEFTPPSTEDRQADEWISQALGGFWEPSRRDSVRELHPTDFDAVSRDDAVAMHPQSGALAVYRDGTITLYELDPDGKYRVAIQESLDEEGRQAVLGYGHHIVISFEDGKTQIWNSGIEPQTFSLFDEGPPRQAVVSGSGRWIAVHSHAGKVWLYDCESAGPIATQLSGSGEFSAVAFTPQGHLLLADRIRRVREIDLPTGQIVSQYTPNDETLMRVYRWGIDPLYTLLPKPSELDALVGSLMTEERTRVITNDQFGETGLDQTRETIDIWTPLWSNLAFLSVMIALSCWHISRRDF